MNPEEIKSLADDDRRHVWHPFTQMKDWLEEEPLVIDRGIGVELIDTEGRRYLDGVSSLWTNVHGHQVPEIDEAVREQIGKIAHSTLLGLGNVPSIELARELAGIAPEGLTKVFYSDSGSTAVEIALKMAFQYWQQLGPEWAGKKRFACVRDAYHGDTIGSVSVGGIDLFHEIYRPLLFETESLPSPFCYRCPLGLERATCDMACAAEAEATIAAKKDELAAVVMEPLVQGAAGIIVHPEGFLSRVAEACRANGVLLILDEVATGFGRTGTMFACEQEGVAPDFLCLAKGISGGYLPLAATLVSERVFEGFLGTYESFRTFFHGHTYTGNPLACAAALGSLKVFRERAVLEHVNTLAADLAERLAAIAGAPRDPAPGDPAPRDPAPRNPTPHVGRGINSGGYITSLRGQGGTPHVGHVRQRGLMAGIELVRDAATGEKFAVTERIGHRVVVEARRRGAIVRPLGDTIVLMPPLAISREQLGRLVDIVVESIAAVTGK